jgi:alanine-glyoxylate transaminase / (R)-3-amino-2-methylpropionate-pyruvate transaminase
MNVSSDVAMPPCTYTPPAYNGPSRDEVQALRQRYVHPSVFALYKEPIMVVDGYMQWLFDETGSRYLDMLAGIVTVSVGHRHPKVMEAIAEQLRHVQHATTIYLHPNLPLLAEKVAAKLPEGLDVTYFVNSGSEANELAVNMARSFTGNTDVVALRNGYHGMSSTSMGLTSHYSWKHNVAAGHRIHHAMNPDPYRNPFEGTRAEIAAKSAEELRDLLRFTTPGKVAGFIAEPIQGVGGTTFGDPSYLKEAYGIIREHEGLCISDEVQTGFGRTGDHFWGFQHSDVVPDIVTMAKGIGNGVPLAAVTTRREIAKAFTGRLHFNTYGGNPVSMAAGLAVMDVIEEEGLQENSRIVGARLLEGLRSLMDRHELIGDVRGQGLMLGIELVTDRETKAPAKEATALILEECREHGVLIGKGGLYGNALRIKPPMCITAEDADFAIDVLDAALEVAGGR